MCLKQSLLYSLLTIIYLIGERLNINEKVYMFSFEFLSNLILIKLLIKISITTLLVRLKGGQ